MTQVTIHRKPIAPLPKRQTKFGFLHDMEVGKVATVSTREMDTAEQWRTLRSLRSRLTTIKQHYGKHFRAGLTKAGIQVERLA